MSTNHEANPLQHIGIVFSPRKVYCPTESGTMHPAVMRTLLPALDPAEFDYVLNGTTTGEMEGITLRILGNVGVVEVSDRFAATYRGTWPARLEVRHLRGGDPADPTDLGVLELDHVDNAVPVEMIAELAPVEIEIPPPGQFSYAIASARFLDAQRNRLPLGLVDWGVHLDSPAQGVTVVGNEIVVAPDALPGAVTVRISGEPAFERVLTLQLRSATATAATGSEAFPSVSSSDPAYIGVSFEPPALYVSPTLAFGQQYSFMSTIHPIAENGEFDYLLNKELGPVENLRLYLSHNLKALIADGLFIRTYTGPWPAEVIVRYKKNGRPTESVRIHLLDPRSAVAVRMEVDYTPVVEIPTHDGEVFTQLRLALLDAQDIPLPDGYGWDVPPIGPFQGIRQDGNNFFISNKALPGDYAVKITTLWQLEKTVSFKLVAASKR